MNTNTKITAFRMTLFAAACAAAALCGCQTAHVRCDGDGKWEASVNSHWFRRDIDGFEAEVTQGGQFKLKLNGYKGDASEQLPAFTREMWNGLAVLGRMAAGTAALHSADPAGSDPAGKTEGADPHGSADCTDGSCTVEVK